MVNDPRFGAPVGPIMGVTIGFVTIEEYRLLPGPGAAYKHQACEGVRHEGPVFPPSVAVIALNTAGFPLVWGVCAECFADIDDDLGPGADWYQRAPE